ncbi:unnamed protein product [Bemisia tabaci]|uniref:PX domain-containing protein n=1 Tax=Bemisia tabaci TaxID=7038 RepID=A0A9P0A8K3_BEMTA|nr:unnamed protein product [Bemisia tabaci]
MDDAIDEPQFKFNRGTMKLSPELPKSLDDHDGEISSWTSTPNETNGTNGTHSSSLNETTNSDDHNDLTCLRFEIVSTKTVQDDNAKKYVTYVMRVRLDGSEEDVHDTRIERRYTDFLELFSQLKQEQPTIMAQISFPRKLLVGNFSQESIACRSTSFEYLLRFVAVHDKLKLSPTTVAFLQQKEMTEVRHHIANQQHSLAIPILENTFRLLNKFYTDRHPAVLRALCLLVACCHAARSPDTERYAGIALRRFQGVSDFDLLQYYVPLLQLCATLDWTRAHKEHNYGTIIKERLADMKRRGMKVDGCLPLLELLLQHQEPKRD